MRALVMLFLRMRLLLRLRIRMLLLVMRAAIKEHTTKVAPRKYRCSPVLATMPRAMRQESQWPGASLLRSCARNPLEIARSAPK